MSNKFAPLTSMRFFAACLVLLHHSVRIFLPDFAGKGAYGVPEDYSSVFFFAFPVSVGFLFMLSGYVLSLVYLDKGQAIDNCRVFAARFARLYPLYFVVLVL